MKRTIPTILFLIFISFTPTETENCIAELFNQIDPDDKGVYKKIDSQNEFGIRQTVDSLSYDIIRRWTMEGIPIIESVSNEYTNIDLWKDFYENGSLRKTGYMTTSNNTYIGTWKYYSKTGQLDSIVNYDKKYKISFCDFYKICEEKKLTGKSSLINFNSKQRKWRIEKWIYEKDRSIATGIELQVDTKKIEEINLYGIH